MPDLMTHKEAELHQIRNKDPSITYGKWRGYDLTQRFPLQEHVLSKINNRDMLNHMDHTQVWISFL